MSSDYELGEPVPEPLLTVADAVDYPDTDAEHAARLRQLQLAKPAGSLGRLEDLSLWAASVQGQNPPHDFGRARLVVFAGDHGIAAAQVSAYDPASTGQMVDRLRDGRSAAAVLAAAAGVGVRVVDLAVDRDGDTDDSPHRVRRSSGSIDREDALTVDEARRAVAAGMAVADEEIDSGAELLLLGDIGVGSTTVAAVLISLLTDVEPIKVVGRGSGIDDAGWIRKCAAIRDARRRARPYRHDLLALLACTAGADLAAMTGFLMQAAYRRTPVLLDGVVTSAAAVVAQQATPRIVRWLRASHVTAEPAHRLALDRLGLDPLLSLGIGLGEGVGALLMLPLLRAATATLRDVAVTSIEDEPAADEAAADEAAPDGL